MNNTILSTNSLKGIGILAVLINHYLNMNISGDSVGFANVVIGIFFIVSGYGIFYSLDRSFKESPLTVWKVLNFYYGRAARIFPLFFCALIIESLIRSNGTDFFMIPGIDYSGHYWFVPAIFQCYIFAPAIYFCMRKNRIVTICIALIVFIAITYVSIGNYIPESIAALLKMLRADYRGLLFFNVLIFSLSMCLPFYINNWGEVSVVEKKFLLGIVLLFVLLAMIGTKYQNDLPFLFKILNDSIYAMVLLYFVIIFMIANSISFKWLSFLGKISYSIYLFHMSVYLTIDKCFEYKMDSLMEFLFFLLFISFFFGACIYIEKAGSRIALMIKR